MKIHEKENHEKNAISSLDITKLMERITEENDFFTKLVDTIPAKMYFNQDMQEKITAEKHSVMNKAVQDLKRKYSNQPELSSKNKHKRARLDPFIQKSVSQIQQEQNGVKKRKKKIKGLNNPSLLLKRAANIEELQKRLQEKIQMVQDKRKAANSSEKKRLKNKFKNIKNKGNLTKIQDPVEKPKKKSEKKNLDTSSSKPVYNKEGKILYSKFDFAEIGREGRPKGELSGKNYKHLLKKVEKNKEKIEKLKSTDPEKAQTLLEKEKWNKAIQLSEGIKIKDDPTLLKNSLKRQEKRKKRSSKAWQGRIEHVETQKRTRQEKRDKNIKAKKENRKENKIKRAKKKGRVVIPGF